MKIIRHSAFARAGLIGNPSDGYGGRTISFAIEDFAAEVVLYPWDQIEIIWSEQDKNRFDTLSALVDDVELNGYYGGVRLVKATIKRFAEYCLARSIPLHDDNFSIRYHTNIPRGVGMSGSSAIIVATLRCLLEFYDVKIPLHLQASLARSIENDELGIACGYQDRVVQVYEGLVYMDFSNMKQEEGFEFGDYSLIDGSKLPLLYIAYDETASKTSGSVHGPLRARLKNDSDLSQTMTEIADLVPLARQAIERGDMKTLDELIDRNFDLRCALYDIAPNHLQMIQAARSAGASAKFAGSGGAIVGAVEGDAMFERLTATLEASNRDWRVIRPCVAGVADRGCKAG